MSSPSRMVQRAIVAALTASANVQALLGPTPRIFQEVSTDAELPYVTLGTGQDLDDSVQFLHGQEIFSELHAWSVDSGFGECKDIAAAIVDEIHDADLVLEGNQRCVLIEHVSTRYLDDPDGKTKHAVITFKALTEPTT